MLFGFFVLSSCSFSYADTAAVFSIYGEKMLPAPRPVVLYQRVASSPDEVRQDIPPPPEANIYKSASSRIGAVSNVSATFVVEYMPAGSTSPNSTGIKCCSGQAKPDTFI